MGLIDGLVSIENIIARWNLQYSFTEIWTREYCPAVELPTMTPHARNNLDPLLTTYLRGPRSVVGDLQAVSQKHWMKKKKGFRKCSGVFETTSSKQEFEKGILSRIRFHNSNSTSNPAWWWRTLTKQVKTWHERKG